MGRRNLSNRNIRKLFRTGGGKSYGLIVPMEFIKYLKWKETQKVVFELDKRRKRIIIEDWPASPKYKRGEGKKKQ